MDKQAMDEQPWTINGLKHVEQLFFIVHSCLSMAVRPWLFVHGAVRPCPWLFVHGHLGRSKKYCLTAYNF